MFFARRKSSLFGSLLSSLLLLLLLLGGAAHPALASSCPQRGAACASESAHPSTQTHTNEAVTLSPITLNGLDQTMTVQMPVDVEGIYPETAGWHIQIGMTQLSNADHALPLSWSVAMNGTCDTPNIYVECEMPNCYLFLPGESESLSPSVGTITAGTSTPTMTTVLSASSRCGWGQMTISTTLSATLLAKDTYTGSYAGLFELTVVDGP